ncbi:MAG: glycosyltransferase family 2 protein [Treponema sp.]|nr:glycosyltransferase family 2 protein [Treponema sp.]
MCSISPIFSIIIPVYNVEDYLSECIESVINQTFNNYECILIDDGSTDKSSIICDFFALKNNKLKVIHKNNSGLSETRNIGILNSSGVYIIFLDSDDMFSNNEALFHLNNIIINTNAPVVFNSNLIFINKKTNDYLSNEQFNGYNVSYDSIIFFRIIMKNKNIILAGWLFTVQREYLIENNLLFKHGILHEDELWMPFIICNSNIIAINHNPFYSYRINRENSIMSVIKPKMLLDKQLIINEIQLKKNIISKSKHFILNARCIMLWNTIFDVVFYLDNQYNEEKELIIKNLIKQKTVLIHGQKIIYFIYYFSIILFGLKNTFLLRKLKRKYLHV